MAKISYVVGNPIGTCEEVITCLEWLCNSKGVDDGSVFRKAVATLKDKYGTEITTKFLAGLIQDKSKAVARIAYLLKVAGFKTDRISRFYKQLSSHRRHKTITEYKPTKNFKVNITEFKDAVTQEVTGRWYQAEGLNIDTREVEVCSWSPEKTTEREILFKLVLK